MAIDEEEDNMEGNGGRLKTIGEEEDQKGLGTQPTVKQLHGEDDNNDNDEEGGEQDEYDENPNNNYQQEEGGEEEEDEYI